MSHAPPRHSVSEVDAKYQHFFRGYQQFNHTQSVAFHDAYRTDVDLVVSAPTGAGKTVLCELALIRMLQLNNNDNNNNNNNNKAVYMAPTRALCDERHREWLNNLKPLGISCMLLTGDIGGGGGGDHGEVLRDIERARVIITTPEKWDSISRRWRDADHTLTRRIQLFMIDEVHLLGEDDRGATLEIIVSRMKTIRSCSKAGNAPRLRFVAISATVPNIGDVANWIGSSDDDSPATAKYHVIDPDERPVKLTYIVKGYPSGPQNASLFKFDMNLNYKLPHFISLYSNNQPTLIFCSTRVSAEHCANALSQQLRLTLTEHHKRHIAASASHIQNENIRKLLLQGLAFHHAALIDSDRQAVESLFRNGVLPILVSTSTLALGVNLPAHLVIVKSTAQLFSSSNDAASSVEKHATSAQPREYSITQIQQMIGRAGRPQFDKNGAVAVILTRECTEQRYREMLKSGNHIESVLHRHMTEHVNAEIALKTFTSLDTMRTWLKSTFFYLRLMQNPEFYGFQRQQTQQQIDVFLENLCRHHLDRLSDAKVIDIEQKKSTTTRFLANFNGIIMARYCISLETMKLIIQLDGNLSLQYLCEALSHARELDDVRLRHTEKSALNALNSTTSSPNKKSGAASSTTGAATKTKHAIRYPVAGRVQTTAQKANVLVQATLGCMGGGAADDGNNSNALDGALKQDVLKIFRAMQRIMPCLLAHLRQRFQSEILKVNRNSTTTTPFCLMYRTVTSACLLAKCFRARLWENSPHKMKQLVGIGDKLSMRLFEHGLVEFEQVRTAPVQHLEAALQKKPPFGAQLVEQVERLPRYALDIVRQSTTNSSVVLEVHVRLQNWQSISSRFFGTQFRRAPHFQQQYHAFHLLVGDSENRLYFCERLLDKDLVSLHATAEAGMPQNSLKKIIHMPTTSKATATTVVLYAHVISEQWVGVDRSAQYSLADKVCTKLTNYADEITARTLSGTAVAATSSTTAAVAAATTEAATSTGGRKRQDSNDKISAPKRTKRAASAKRTVAAARSTAKQTKLTTTTTTPVKAGRDDDASNLDWVAEIDFNELEATISNNDDDSKLSEKLYDDDSLLTDISVTDAADMPPPPPPPPPPADDADDSALCAEISTRYSTQLSLVDGGDCVGEMTTTSGDGGSGTEKAVDDAARIKQLSYEERVLMANKIDVFRPRLDALLKRFHFI